MRVTHPFGRKMTSVNRRDFIKISGPSAGAALHGMPAWARNLGAMDVKALRNTDSSGWGLPARHRLIATLALS